MPAVPLKIADDTMPSYGLRGQLVVSDSGWVLLQVPNALGNGVFQSLDEPGIEQPPSKTKGTYNAHISVMRDEELEKIGGASALKERGKSFGFTIKDFRSVKVSGYRDYERVWFLRVRSPELEELRASYGLPRIPKKRGREMPFHITVAVRRQSVAQKLRSRKVAQFPGMFGRVSTPNLFSRTPATPKTPTANNSLPKPPSTPPTPKVPKPPTPNVQLPKPPVPQTLIQEPKQRELGDYTPSWTRSMFNFFVPTDPPKSAADKQEFTAEQKKLIANGEACAACAAVHERSDDGYCNSCGCDYATGDVPKKGRFNEGKNFSPRKQAFDDIDERLRRLYERRGEVPGRTSWKMRPEPDIEKLMREAEVEVKSQDAIAQKQASISDAMKTMGSEGLRVLSRVSDAAKHHAPRIRMPDTVVGSVLGGLAGATRAAITDDDADSRTRKYLTNIIGGSLIGAGVGNLVGDRTRRYIANNTPLFGYNVGADAYVPRSLKHVWETAVLDKPVHATLRAKNTGTLPQFAGRARMELLRRHMGLPVTGETVFESTGTKKFTPTYMADGSPASGGITGDYPHLKFSPAAEKRYATHIKKMREDLGSTTEGVRDRGFATLFSRHGVAPDSGGGVRVFDHWDFGLSPKEYGLLRGYIANPQDWAKEIPRETQDQWLSRGEVDLAGEQSSGRFTQKDHLATLIKRIILNDVLGNGGVVFDQTFRNIGKD